MKKNSLFFTSVSILIIYSSCTQKLYKDYNLFQKGMDSLKNYDYKPLIIQNNDGLVIQIYSATLSQDQVAVFNMGGAPTAINSVSSNSSGGASSLNSSSNSGQNSYLVDVNGEINMPILGKIKATGLTTEEVRKELFSKLTPYIKDPIVIVKFVGIKVNVLGAVMHPGIQTFASLNPTIIDAISQAGDFSDGAKRKEVYLIRDINGKRSIFKLDFVSDATIFNSEAYQLVQNDLIYVPSNDMKLKLVNQDPDIQKKIQVSQMVLQALSAIAVIINTYFLFKRI